MDPSIQTLVIDVSEDQTIYLSTMAYTKRLFPRNLIAHNYIKEKNQGSSLRIIGFESLKGFLLLTQP